jgi:hypothetical protein
MTGKALIREHVHNGAKEVFPAMTDLPTGFVLQSSAKW